MHPVSYPHKYSFHGSNIGLRFCFEINLVVNERRSLLSCQSQSVSCLELFRFDVWTNGSIYEDHITLLTFHLFFISVETLRYSASFCSDDSPFPLLFLLALLVEVH